MEPKQVDFCIIKQKIIKTDEVIHMYLENNNKLKKTIQVIKELKCKYDFSQLENERCTYSLNQLKSKHEQLETQCEELINHKAFLEQKYNQTLIDSQSYIKTLENELQMLKELNTAAEIMSPKKSSTTELSSKKFEELEKQLVTCKESEVELKKEYNNLTKENTNLKVHLDRHNEEKRRALNLAEKEKATVLQELHCEMDNKIKLHEQQCQQKDKEIHELKLSVSETHSLKNRISYLEKENGILKANLIKCQSLIEAETNKNIRKTKTVSIQTDANFPHMVIEEYSKEPDAKLTEISNYYYTPIPLSPMCSPSPANFIEHIPKITYSDSPNIIVTPSTPLEETVNEFPENCNNPQSNFYEPNVIKSIITDDTMSNASCKNEIKKPVSKRMSRSLNRKIMKRRVPVKKILKKKTQDSILRALQILNKSKIPFTISNESSFPMHNNSMKECSGNQPDIVTGQMNLKHLVEGLPCNLQNCNEIYMLLNESNKGLLGFFNKKEGNITPSRNIIEDSKLQNPLTNCQNKLKQEITSENILDKLAELVCEKLKNTTKRPDTFKMDSSGYISETEGELGHLFEKPNNDILALNALLMKNLRRGCLIQETQTNMGSEVSSEISLPSYLNDRSQTSSVTESSSKLYSSENYVMSTSCPSRPESNQSDSECNGVIGVSKSNTNTPICKLDFVEDQPRHDNTPVVDCSEQGVEMDVKDFFAVDNTNNTESGDVSLIDWPGSSTSHEKDVNVFCNDIDVHTKLDDKLDGKPNSPPNCNFSTNNSESIYLDLGANTEVTLKNEKVEFPEGIKCESDAFNERKIKILNVEIYKNFVKQIDTPDFRNKFTMDSDCKVKEEEVDKDSFAYGDINEVKVLNLHSIKKSVEQAELIKSEEHIVIHDEIANNSYSDNSQDFKNIKDDSQSANNQGVNYPNAGSTNTMNYNFSPLVATHRSPSYSSPNSKSAKSNLSSFRMSAISTAPALLSPLSDSSTISMDSKKSEFKSRVVHNKNNSIIKGAANKDDTKHEGVKFLINNKFKELWSEKIEMDSNETWLKSISDTGKMVSPRSNTKINKDKRSASIDETTTLPIFPNADNCINSLLIDENIMTEEIDSFLNIFQSNKSFSELNQSIANSTFDSKIPRQLFTKKSTLNPSDKCNKTAGSEISLKTENIDIKAEYPLSPEPVSNEAEEIDYKPKIIPLERVEEIDITSAESTNSKVSTANLSLQIVEALKEATGTKNSRGRHIKINSSMEVSKPTPVIRTRRKRLCNSKLYDSDEWITDFKPENKLKNAPSELKVFEEDLTASKTPNKNQRRISETSCTSDSGVLDKEFVPKKARKKRASKPKMLRKTSTSDSDSPDQTLPSEELNSDNMEVLKAKDTFSVDDEEKDSCSGKNKIDCNPNQAVPVKRGRGRPRKYPKVDKSKEKNESVAKEVDNCILLTDTECNKTLSKEEDIEDVSLLLGAGDTKQLKARKPMKKITKLKSKIMKQMKEKQKMFQKQPVSNVLEDSSVGCDVRIKENLIETDSINRISNNDTNLSSKINKLQNEDCNKSVDVMLPIYVSSLVQSDPGNVNLNLKNEELNTVVRKKKARKNTHKSDILSQIIKDMDRIKPQMKRTVIKRDVPEGIDEKQWRKNVLEIAEIVHDKRNIDMKDIYGPQPYKRHCTGILVNGSKVPAKITVLLKKLLAITNEDEIPESIMLEFKRFPIDKMIDIVLYQMSRDIHDQPDRKYDPAPLMTRTQRIFLGLLVRLEKEKGYENILEYFFFRTQEYIFKRGCTVQAAIPLTRLFLSLCRLHANINRMRTFCCEAFFHSGDLAIPIFFTVLTSWIDVMPSEADIKTYPLAKVLFQLVHLKTCKKPGFNLFPLKCLLSQYHGYPTERWDCDKIFEELIQEYLSNPCIASDYAIRLFCKNKDTKFVYKKLNEFFKPLIYKIPSENVNFKSATIILMGKICRQFKVKNEHDQKSLVELKRWFEGLLEDKPADLVKQSINISIEHLPSKKKRPKNYYFDSKIPNADTCANERTF